MSFSQDAILWLHIAAAIFALGPGTAAIMSTPRHIRRRNAVVVGHLYRTTRIYTLASLLVAAFGIALAAMRHDFAKWWVSASLTLYVVAVVLLLLIMRDQRRAAKTIEQEGPAAGGTPVRSGESETETTADPGVTGGGQPASAPAPAPGRAAHVAAVERARIASMSGVVGLIWLVILAMMVWR